MSKARDLANAGTALTTVSATELGYLDGVTSAVQTQINAKQATVSGVNDTEIGYLDGVTSAIQTQLDGKVPATIVDAKGDIIAATAADTVARLGVGANGTVLTAASGQTTGLEWAAPGGATLLSTTTLSGATTVISSIPSTYKTLKVIIYGVTNATSTGKFKVDFGGNGWVTGAENGSNYTTNNAVWATSNTTSNVNGDNVYVFTIDAYNGSNPAAKPIHATYFFVNNNQTINIPGFFDGIVYKTSAINSVTISNLGGNLTNGTALVYGVN
jgi:hypothetical protein